MQNYDKKMAYHLLSDEVLGKMLKADDHAAFKEIYKRYWKSLFIAAQRKLRSDEICEELVQNIFLSLWEKRNGLLIENLRGYLFNALKYQVVDHLRKQLLAERYSGVLQTRPEQLGESPDDTLNFQDISSIFERIFGQLPEKTSRIFHLSRIEHKSTREISRLLRIPERTVEYHITQSLKILREQLGDFLPFWLFLLSLGDNIGFLK